MRIENIESSSVFARLDQILMNDIEILKNALAKQEAGDVHDFLDSLQAAKVKIRSNDVVRSEGYLEGGVNTPNSNHANGYSKNSWPGTKDRVELIDYLLAHEEGEFEMIQSAYTERGMPDDLKQKLQGIMNAYQQIIDQLKRSKSTQQYGTIVI